MNHGGRAVQQPMDLLCHLYRRLTGRGGWQARPEGRHGGTDLAFVDVDWEESRYLGVPATVADHFGLLRHESTGYTQGLNLWWIFTVWDCRGGDCKKLAGEVRRLVDGIRK